MYDVCRKMFFHSGECGWFRETRCVYIYVRPVTKWQHWAMFIHWGNKGHVPTNAVEMPPALSS